MKEKEEDQVQKAADKKNNKPKKAKEDGQEKSKTDAISSSAQRQEALRKSKERLQAATDAAEVAVWELDLQNDEGLYISPRYAEMLGYEEVPEDWNVERALEHYHPDDQERLMHYLEDGLGKRMFESQITRTDGEQRWILVGSEVYEDSDGTPVRAVGTMQDITERKQREEAIQKSEEKYRTLFESMDEGFCVIDLIYDDAGEAVDYRFVEVNKAFSQLTGLEDPRGKTDKELGMNTESHRLERYAEVAQTGEPVRHKDYHESTGNWYQVYISRVGGEESNRLVIVFNDTTELKQRERSNGRLAAIVNDSDDAIISKDLDGIIQSWNNGAENLFGYTAEEVVGRSVTVLFPKDRLDEEDEILEQLRHGKQIDHYETVRRHKDGTLLNVSLTISPIRNAEGRIIGASKIARDITKRKQREEQQEFMLEFSDVLRALTNPDEIEEHALQMLSEQMGLDRCYIASYRLADDRADIIQQVGNERVPPMPDQITLSDFPEALQTALDQTLVIDDITKAESLSDTDRQNMSALGMGALAASAVRRGKGNPLWTIAVVSAEPREWTQVEVALLDEATERTWQAKERARVGKSLRENEERLSNAIDAADYGTWELNMKTGDFVSRSARHDQVFGYDEQQEEWNLERTLDHIFLDDKRNFMEALKRARDSGRLTFEGRIQRRDERIRRIYAKGIVISTDGGHQPKKMAGVVGDITERKRRTILEETQNRLLESIASDQPLRETLRELCEAMPKLDPGVRVSILLADEESESFKAPVAPDLLPSWNKTLDGMPVDGQMIGTCGQAISKNKPVSCTNVKKDDRWSDEWRELCLANGILAGHSVPIEARGEAEGSFMLCFNEPREPSEWEHQLLTFATHTAGIALERHRTKKSLRETNEQLEERVARRTESLRKSQNKLRSLVNELNKAEDRERRRIAGELHDNLGQTLAVTKLKLDSVAKKVNEQQITEASDLLNDAIQYTRDLMNSLKPPDRFEKEDVKKAVKWLAKQMKKYDLTISIEDDGQPKSLSDEMRPAILRSLRELLFNVIKHSGQTEAVVRLSRKDGHLKAAVKDDGKGFDRKKEYEADESDSGFGLLNIKERLNLLDGDLKIESAPGRGTEAVITVPLRDSQEQTEAESEDKAGRQLETKFKEKDEAPAIGVMLVDDHEVAREGLVTIIEEEDNFHLSGEAKNGREAVEKARDLMPDVVVMDIKMPEMNGIEATKQIKEEWPDIQIVGLSFYNDEDKAAAMRKAGASAFITKSNAMEKLNQTIREV